MSPQVYAKYATIGDNTGKHTLGIIMQELAKITISTKILCLKRYLILQWKSRNQAPQVHCELFTRIISKGNTSNFLSSPSYVIKINK